MRFTARPIRIGFLVATIWLSWGLTPLLLASRTADVELMNLLIELGVDPNVVDKNGETAMHGAAYRNYPSAVATFAKVGASPAGWDKKNKHGWKPHDIASGKRPGSFKPSPATAKALDLAKKFEK